MIYYVKICAIQGMTEMKIKHLENIRLVLLSLNIVSTILTKGNNQLFNELEELLNNGNISLEDYRYYSLLAFDISVLTGFKMEQLTKDYERIESFYNAVISNTAELIEALGIQDDPVKVFALFVYLYRSGYMSVDKHFMYSINMKDLPLLNGVDVIRGTGVCRSISSMFTDVCNSVGLSATNVCVRANGDGLNKKEALSLVSLEVEKRGRFFANIVGKVTSIIPIGNHLVTAIEHDNATGIYDPTNDIFMHTIGQRRYPFINDTSATMSYSFISNLFPKMLGQMDTEANYMYLKSLSNKNKIDYEQYRSIYEEINRMILANQFLFEEFYKINLPYYREVSKLANEQHGMIKRMFPIIPGKSKKSL